VGEFDPERYDEQLTEKSQRITELFRHLEPPTLEVFSSPAAHYRMRAEFKVWHEPDASYFAMFKQGETKKPYKIENFAIGSQLINELMPRLLAEINQDELLKRKLFQCDFLTTRSGEALISMIYHRKLDEAWREAATLLKTNLNVDIVGRSKNQKIVLGREFVIEKLCVDNKIYTYQQVDSSFTQPNAAVSEKMLDWAVDVAKPLAGDLLELYCGNGNFTIPLAGQFVRVLATEIAKSSVKSALYNLDKNNIQNVTLLRMSSEEVSEALQKKREFRRLKDINLDQFALSTVLVDPPRSGLDDNTISLLQRFDNIIYVSCNPDTLLNNLTALAQTHRIERFALFDQFPYTHHIESGVFLKRKQKTPSLQYLFPYP